MKRLPFSLEAGILVSQLVLLGCGESSGPVLTRVDERVPPRWRLRADFFIVQDVRSCAAGRPCSANDPNQCFSLTNPAGDTLLFEPDGLEFLPAGDERIALAPQNACFRLVLDAPTVASIHEAAGDFRSTVFRLSQGQIDLDLRIHELPAIPAGFKRWENGFGIFLEPYALEPEGLPRVHRDTDYVFAVTGESDPDLGYLPSIGPCAGTNWQEQGGFAGTAYTWFSASCASSDRFMRHFLIQSYFALRDVMSFDDLYPNRYPACGSGDPNPERWFPRLDDCAVDPDASSCGDAQCVSGEAFLTHIFDAHWPADRAVVGNHCRNLRQDFDETGIDQGGVCDRLGR